MLSYAKNRESFSKIFMWNQKELEASLLENPVMASTGSVMVPLPNTWGCIKRPPQLSPFLSPWNPVFIKPVSSGSSLTEVGVSALYSSCGKHPAAEAEILSTWNDYGVLFEALKNLSHLKTWPDYCLLWICFETFYTIGFSPFSGLSPQEEIQLVEDKLYAFLVFLVKYNQV